MTSGAIQVLKTHPEKTLHLWVMSSATYVSRVSDDLSRMR